MTRQVGDPRIRRWLFGARDGSWMLARGAGGAPKVQGLECLGAPSAVVAYVHRALRDRGPDAGSGRAAPAGLWLANICDVRPASISHYLHGGEPELDADGWQRLVLAWYGRPGFTCPECGRTSFNPNDLLHGFCGACQQYTGGWARVAG